jgi:hypothetical protein
MQVDISQLEQAWLRAETMADEAKRDAVRASGELQAKNAKVVDAGEIKILLTSVQQAKDRQDEAERQASAAFDQLWQAKGQRQVHA